MSGMDRISANSPPTALPLTGMSPCRVLEGLAAYLHIPGDEIQKTAADTHQDYVDDTTPHMKVMEGICDGMSRIVKLSGEIRHLEQSLRDRWKEAKEGIK